MRLLTNNFKTLDKYLYLELCKAFSLIMFILMVILLSNQLVFNFGQLNTGKLSAYWLLQIIILQAPELMVFIIPAAMFAAIILVLNRLALDQELIAWIVAGLNKRQLHYKVLLLTSLISCLLFILQAYFIPIAQRHKADIMDLAQQQALTYLIKPGKFQSLPNNNTVIYSSRGSDKPAQWSDAERTVATKHLNQVFIASAKHGSKNFIIYAKSADIINQNLSGSTNDLKQNFRGQAPANNQAELQLNSIMLRINQGNYYFGQPGKHDFKWIQFDQYTKILPKISCSTPNKAKTKSLIKLLAGYFKKSLDHQICSAADNAELMWRLALPLSLLALSSLVTATTQLRARAINKNLRLIPYLLIFSAYFASLIMLRRLIANGGSNQHVLMLLNLLLPLGIIFWAHIRITKQPHWTA